MNFFFFRCITISTGWPERPAERVNVQRQQQHTMLSSRISPTLLLLTTMAIVTGESFVQFWFLVYSRVISGEIRLVTLHHLKEKKSIVASPLLKGLLIPFSEPLRMFGVTSIQSSLFQSSRIDRKHFHPHNTFGLVEAWEALSRSF